MFFSTTLYDFMRAILGREDEEDKPYNEASTSVAPYPRRSMYRDTV